MQKSDERWETFKRLAPYFNRVVSAKFIQDTAEQLPGVIRLHNLIEGIYKPKDSPYALAIASMLKNPYADRIEFNPDRSWYFYYSAKVGSLESAVNIALLNCMRDGEPVLVLKQLSDKTHAQGARYKILGLGLVEAFDPASRLFKMREVTIEAFQRHIDPSQILSDDLIETALQLEALEDWSPFAAEDRAIYKVSKQKRDAAFRKVVLDSYGHACAVSQLKFAFTGVVEAQAAHIIAKEVNGTDDPRNGLALSRTAHWAFDQGIFTITDQYEVQIHPKALFADHRNFQLFDLDKKNILLPNDDSYLPHPDALRWHRENVFGKFIKR